jgi:hypothetical protein
MKTRKIQTLALGLLCGLPLLSIGCSDVNTGEYTYVTFDSGGPVDGGNTLNPVPPFPGQQIDRVGRPGISRLLLNPFNQAGITTTPDSYNAASDSKNSFEPFYTDIAVNLAIWDGFNNPPTQAQGGQCGDQPLAGAAAAAGRYDTLARILARDYLIVDTTQRNCNRFMALELNVQGDCGGRPPSLNAVDAMLNILQGGSTSTNPATTPMTTGIAVDPDGVPSMTFPFLQGAT